uniref:Cell division cycle associated 7 like n=1 Tax=Oryzias sinensis TaxID=183150 RepID=A0A8C7ZU60_9TELE
SSRYEWIYEAQTCTDTTICFKQAPRFKSKFITAELARLFSQSDTEEEFEGFSEDEEDGFSFNRQKKVVDSEGSDVDTGFYSDGEDASPLKRRSLLVALRCDTNISRNKSKSRLTQNLGRGRRARHENQEKDEEEEARKEKADALSHSLNKRKKNIQENKAMLAKLFADLSSMADLTLPSPKQKTSPQKRRLDPDVGSGRRNPSRKARPPENFAVEEKSEPVLRRSHRDVDIKRLIEVDEDHVGVKRRKIMGQFSRKSAYVVKSVDEITKEDLDNIAFRSKDKIWDKENGSSCHQCRQKTLDTKTVCRSGFCVGGKGQFCGPCLKNRYGEDVGSVLLNPTWSCPICRGVCNCSLCRKKEGRCATGILVGLARYNGHDNVHKYLER